MIVTLLEEDGTYWADIQTKLSNMSEIKKIKKTYKFDKEKLEVCLRSSLYQHTPSLFPPAVHYLSTDARTLIWERPPCYKSISYTNTKMELADYDVKEKNTFRIPVPWQIYIAHLSKDMRIVALKMFFRNDKLSHDNNGLAYPYLPNFYSDASLCRASLRTVTNYESTIAGVMQAGMEMIWDTGFNADLFQGLHHGYNHTQISLFEKTLSGGAVNFLTLVNYLKMVSVETVVSWNYNYFTYLEEVKETSSVNSDEMFSHQMQRSSLIALCDAIQDSA